MNQIANMGHQGGGRHDTISLKSMNFPGYFNFKASAPIFKLRTLPRPKTKIVSGLSPWG